MIQLARQNAVAAAMSGQKNHIASGQPAREQIIRWRTEWCFDLHPFLVCEAFDVVKSRAADDSNAMLRHAQLYSIAAAKSRQCFSWGNVLIEGARHLCRFVVPCHLGAEAG